MPVRKFVEIHSTSQNFLNLRCGIQWGKILKFEQLWEFWDNWEKLVASELVAQKKLIDAKIIYQKVSWDYPFKFYTDYYLKFSLSMAGGWYWDDFRSTTNDYMASGLSTVWVMNSPTSHFPSALMICPSTKRPHDTSTQAQFTCGSPLGSANKRFVVAGGSPGRWRRFASTQPSAGRKERQDWKKSEQVDGTCMDAMSRHSRSPLTDLPGCKGTISNGSMDRYW